MNHRPASHVSGPPQDLAGRVLTIDLAAIKENWRRLAAKSTPAECGAAIKGNAYGLGVEPLPGRCGRRAAAPSSWRVPMEGGELRAILPREAVI